MRIVLKKPNEPPVVAELAEGLEAAQALVGGLIEVLALAAGMDLVINEEGLVHRLALNFVVAGEVEAIPIFGSVFFVGLNDEGEFVSLTDEQVATVAKLWTTSPTVPVPVLRLPHHVEADDSVNVTIRGEA